MYEPKAFVGLSFNVDCKMVSIRALDKKVRGRRVSERKRYEITTPGQLTGSKELCRPLSSVTRYLYCHFVPLPNAGNNPPAMG